MSWKKKLQKTAPRTFNALKQIKQWHSAVKRTLHRAKNFHTFYPHWRVEKKIHKHFSGKVKAGPFQGLNYVKRSHGSVLSSKLLGTYEEELYPTIEKVINHRYDYILDIGCAEGYYAVGLAKRCPEAEVLAYDVMFKAQRLCQKMAQINQCDNIQVLGLCDQEEIKKYSNRNAFIFCDIEGAELMVFDPEACPEIVDYDFLIEIHDTPEKNLCEQILPRFENTHNIEIINSRPRLPSDYSGLDFLSSQEQKVAVEELRGEECWGYFTRKST